MRQVALHFTDLHDNPAALFNASRIRKIVPWKDARRFFYFRLKRLLLQNETRLRAGIDDTSYFSALMQRKCVTNNVDWSDDKGFINLLEKNPDLIKEITEEALIDKSAKQIQEFFSNRDKSSILLESIKRASSNFTQEQKAEIINAIQFIRNPEQMKESISNPESIED